MSSLEMLSCDRGMWDLEEQSVHLKNMWFNFISVIYSLLQQEVVFLLFYSCRKNQFGTNEFYYLYRSPSVISLPALISYLIFWYYDSNPKDGGRRALLFNLGFIFSTSFKVLSIPEMTLMALSDLI